MRVTLALAAIIALASPAAAQWKNMPPTPNRSGPPPRTADGKPDLSGVWQADGQTYFFDLAAGLKPEDVVALPSARALQQQREDNLHGDDPLARCLPHGVPRINTNGLFPFKIVQTQALVVVLYEQLNLFRQVFLDGRTLSTDVNPTWLGYSTGKWDGDTLVVDTRGFNGKIWLDQLGRPTTERLHVTERFRRPDYERLTIDVTIDDPGAYTKPWGNRQEMHLRLGWEPMEFICGENNVDLPHL